MIEPRTRGIVGRPKTLSIMPTYTCPAACSNCASLSSPTERTNLSLTAILDAIAQAKQLGFFNVVFTGGEATLRWSDLLTAIAYARSLDFPTRLVTNAHWAHSLQQADNRLELLISAGLSEINYSTGDQHIRFVPLERVVNATVAAVRRGFSVTLVVELTAERKISKATVLDHPMMTSLTCAELDCLKVIESPWMPLNPTVVQEYPQGVAVDRHNLAIKTGCDNVLQTYTVQADGTVGACCGIGMRTIRELHVSTVETQGFLHKAMSEAEDDFLKVWIHYKGPEKILAWAAEKNPEIKWEGMYAHHCQACARIYRDPVIGEVIRQHYEEVVCDVMQAAWLDEEFIPRSLGKAAIDRRL
jgi:organic radical activating enzyme